MGFIDRIRQAVGLPDLTRGLGSSPIASPWTESSTLAPIVTKDIFGVEDIGSLTRESAIRLATVSRARGLIVSTIAGIPLVATDSAGNDAELPQFLDATTGDISGFHRMLWTIDDLFFYGWSLWAVDRTANGTVTAAARVEYHRWSIQDGIVHVDNLPAPAGGVVLIPGVTEGILTHGADTLRQAARLSRAADRAAENPSAQVELHQTNDAPMTDSQIDKLIARWSKARRGENGGVAFTNSSIEVKEHGASNEHLLIDGRNAAAVDVARHAGIPATMIDATLSGSSLSYQNSAARMSELVTFGLAPHMASVAARLSLDDVTPPDVRIKFDTTATLTALADIFGRDDDQPNPLEEELP